MFGEIDQLNSTNLSLAKKRRGRQSICSSTFGYPGCWFWRRRSCQSHQENRVMHWQRRGRGVTWLRGFSFSLFPSFAAFILRSNFWLSRLFAIFPKSWAEMSNICSFISLFFYSIPSNLLTAGIQAVFLSFKIQSRIPPHISLSSHGNFTTESVVPRCQAESLALQLDEASYAEQMQIWPIEALA